VLTSGASISLLHSAFLTSGFVSPAPVTQVVVVSVGSEKR
jgi:hypothetical protein